MLRIEPHVAFEILRILFEPKLATLISSYDEDSIQLIGNQYNFSKSGKARSSVSGLSSYVTQFITTLRNKIQGQMLALIYYCGKKT